MSEASAPAPQLCQSFPMLLGLIAIMTAIAVASPLVGAIIGVLSNALPIWCMTKRSG
jgi:hypothetical protein